MAITDIIPGYKYETDLITLKDGGEMTLDWYKPDETPEDAPIVMICHGILATNK